MLACRRARLQQLAVVVVIVLAAALRLWRMDLVEFRNDEAIAMRLAENMVRLGRVPLIGLTTSPGIKNPADIIYFLAPFVALNRDPSVASAGIALSNVVGVAGTIWLGWRILSPLGGLVAGLSYATSPWAVFYARKVWNPDSVAPWAVLLFLALDYAVVSGSAGWAIAAFPLFAIGLQMHFSFALLAPFLLVPTLLLSLRRQWAHLAVGIALAVLTTTPYLLYGIQTEWSDLRALQALPMHEASIDTDGPNFVQDLTTGIELWFVAGVHLERALPIRIDEVAADVRAVLLGVGVVVALALIAMRRAEREGRVRLAGLLLWLALPPLLTVRHSVPLFEHYFLIVLPAASLLTAVGVHEALRGQARWGRQVGAALLAGVLVLAAVQSTIVVRILAHVATQYEPGYGPTLSLSRQIVDSLAHFGADSGSQRLAIEILGHDSEPAAYLARPYFPVIDLIGEGPVGLGGASRPAPTTSMFGPTDEPHVLYADGVQVLFATTMDRVGPGQRAGAAVTWLATESAGVRWVATLYDPDGKPLAREEGIDRPAATVREGERVTSWFTLPTPIDARPGQYEVGLSRLDRASGQPLSFVDGSTALRTEWRSRPIHVEG